MYLFFIPWRNSPPPSGPRPRYRGFMITLRYTILCRTLLDEWSTRRRDLYLTTHNTHNRQTSMSWVGFEPTIPASERPQTDALERAATGTGLYLYYIISTEVLIIINCYGVTATQLTTNLMWFWTCIVVNILQTGHITLSSTPDQQLENRSTKYHRQQPLYNTLELLMLQHPPNRTHNPQLHNRPATWKPQHEIPQAATTV